MNTYNGKHISIDGAGYYRIYFPEHHKAHNDGYVHVHILQAEKMLGRELREGECVHHIDFNKLNNDESNLMVFASLRMHTAYHDMLKDNSKDFVLKRIDGVYYIESELKHHGKDHCPLCGHIKDKKAQMCIKCRNAKRRKNIPTKKQLYNDLGNMSIVKIGKKYGVSDSAVRKWLKSYDLPYKKDDITTMKKGKKI